MVVEPMRVRGGRGGRHPLARPAHALNGSSAHHDTILFMTGETALRIGQMVIEAETTGAEKRQELAVATERTVKRPVHHRLRRHDRRVAVLGAPLRRSTTHGVRQ